MADHQPREPRLVDLRGRNRVDFPPVAEHGHPLRDLEHLRQPVRDIDDRHAGAREVADDLEQPVRLAVRKRRRRLVEEQHPHLR
jgi:hypothetical protein